MPGDLTPSEMLACLKYLEPSREFRSEFQYQSLGYMAAGMIADQAADLPAEADQGATFEIDTCRASGWSFCANPPGSWKRSCFISRTDIHGDAQGFALGRSRG
jgi:hypothetical protein